MRSVAITSLLLGTLVFVAAGYAAAHETDDNAAPPPGERAYRILKALPRDADSYRPAAAALVRSGIPEKFGHEEWDAIVLTNEFHQHIGIYTVLGAKMGVRAKEILSAPTRAVNVTVETGGTPPYSCLIDGLQVALGSTFAQDLIHAPSLKGARVAAKFEYKGRTLRLALKPDIQKQISDVIAQAIRECGNLTPAYFQRVEEQSYRAWADLDRRVIFDEDLGQLSPSSK